MTGQAERIKEQHRGWRRAEPASRSRLAALDSFGLRYEQVDDFNVVVEGDYQLNLAMSYWRSSDGCSQGYLVSTLHAEINRNRNSEKPATGRDSVAAGRTASIDTHDAAVVAESVAGSISPDAGWESASLLPVVSP